MKKGSYVSILCFACLFLLTSRLHAADVASAETSTSQETGRYGIFAKKMMPNEPIYFAVGTHGGANARFQLSFKYQLTDHILRDDDSLFFTYTQTSFWDLHSRSVPFYDTSYRPGFAYEIDKDDHIRRGTSVPWFQVGIEHESNGKAGPDSRSINIAYVRPRFFFGNPKGTNFQFAPKVWAYIDSSGNSGMEKYRGYSDLLGIFNMGPGFGFFSETQISAVVRKGSDFQHGSYEADIAYPLGSTFYLLLQYFNGYGETILDYNKRDTQYRAGFMFVTW